jgi:hypothetical protein
MKANVGDTIVLVTKTKRVAPNERSGVIEDVLDPEQPRFVVRWDDRRTTVVAPLPGSYRVEKPGRKAKKAEKAESYKPVTPTRQKLRSAPKRTKVKKG